MADISSSLPVLDGADGTAGAASPTTVQLVGGSDGTNLRPLRTDTAGNISTIKLDVAPTNQNITAFDTATISLIGANGQTFYTGNPTTNSTVVFALASINSVVVQANLIGAGGTMVVELSADSSVWFRPNVYQIGTQSYANGFTAPFNGIVNTAGYTSLRVRGTVSWAGTATIVVKESQNIRPITIADALPTGANVIGHVITDSGSTTAVTALPALPAGSNVIGHVIVDTAPTTTVIGLTADGAADTGNPVKIAGSDGTNVQTIRTDTTGAIIISARIALTASSPANVSVGVASTAAVASNANRKGLVLTNTSTAKIFLAFGATAVLNQGIALYPGGIFVMDDFLFNTGAINAIATVAASNLAIQELT